MSGRASRVGDIATQAALWLGECLEIEALKRCRQSPRLTNGSGKIVGSKPVAKMRDFQDAAPVLVGSICCGLLHELDRPIYSEIGNLEN